MEPRAAAPPPKKKAKRANSGPVALSFDLGDEGEEFEVKKKKKPKQKAAPALPPSTLDAGVHTGAGMYTSDMLSKLRGEQAFRAPVGRDDGPIPGDVLPSDGDAAPAAGLPDAEAIREARARRERARRLAEEGGGDATAGGSTAFIPLDGSERRVNLATTLNEVEEEGEEEDGMAKNASRLVREEQTDEDASVFDGQGGERLAFGVPNERPPRTAFTMEAEEDEEEATDGRAATLGTAMGGPRGAGGGVAASSEEAIAAHAARFMGGGEGAERTVASLALEVNRSRESLVRTRSEVDETSALLHASGTACGEMEGAIEVGLADFDYLQRAQAYAEDLLDCLNEKVPVIDEAETRLSRATEAHARAARDAYEAAQAAERARAAAVLRGSWAAPPVLRRARVAGEPPAAATALDAGGDVAGAIASLEAAETRRAARRGGAVAWASWQEIEDDEDEEEEEAAAGEAAAARRVVSDVEVECAGLLEDTLADFAEVRNVRQRFYEWQSTHPASYNDMYLSLCVPTLLSPLVRVRMLTWRPWIDGSLERQGWYSELVSLAQENGSRELVVPNGKGGGGGGGDGEGVLEEKELLAQLACKLGMPRVKHAVGHSWEVHAPSQSDQLVTAVRELRSAVELLVKSAEAAAEGDDAAEAQEVADAASGALRGLQMEVASRLDMAVDDTCIAPCIPASYPAAANSAATASWRGLVRAVGLIGVLGSWCDLLAVTALQQLGWTLLAQHILPYLAACLRANGAAADGVEIALGACERIALSLPPAWRSKPAAGHRDPCSGALCAFVSADLVAAVRGLDGATDGATTRLHKLGEMLDAEIAR